MILHQLHSIKLGGKVIINTNKVRIYNEAVAILKIPSSNRPEDVLS